MFSLSLSHQASEFVSSSATCCSVDFFARRSTVTSAVVLFGSPRTSGGGVAMIVPASLLWNCFAVEDFIPSIMSSTAGGTRDFTSIRGKGPSAVWSLSGPPAAAGGSPSHTSSVERKSGRRRASRARELVPMDRDDRGHQLRLLGDELLPGRVLCELLPVRVAQARGVRRILRDTDRFDLRHLLSPSLPDRVAQAREEIADLLLIELAWIPRDGDRPLASADVDDAVALLERLHERVKVLDRRERRGERELL